MIKAYFLSQMQCSEQTQSIGKYRLSFPTPSPAQISEISDQLIAAQKQFSETPIFKIVDCIALASAGWRNANSPIREKAEAILPETSGLSKEMVSLILDDIFKELTQDKLLQLIEEELGDAAILDHFCKKKNGNTRIRAFGPQFIAQILPGNVLGVSIISLVCGLLVKSANLLRVSREEILLTTLFVESLQTFCPEMAQTIAILTWDKKNTEITRTLFQKADFIIAYGSNKTIAAIQTLIPPHTPRLLHGHKLSLGVMARETLSYDLAKKVALDIVLYDQQGCLSPHLYYVESGGKMTPIDFAKKIAESLQELSIKLPKGKGNHDAASQIQQLRGTLPLKGGVVFESPDGIDWTVLYDPSPEFTPSPLSRCIWIKPVNDLSEIPPLLAPQQKIIQTIGIAIPKMRADKIVESLSKIGGCRICPIGEMQRPPLNWSHDGQKRLLPLLRFVDWE